MSATTTSDFDDIASLTDRLTAEHAASLADANGISDQSWTLPLSSYPGTEPAGLMESLVIGTGFDIAMTQQGLLPNIPNHEVPPVQSDDGVPCLNDTASMDAIDPVLTHHHHY